MLRRLPKVSIITVSFNGKKYIHNFFSSLQKMRYPNWEMVCIDNASSDGSLEILRKLIKKNKSIKLIESSKNLGFARANNRAVKSAKGEYLFFLNNDTKIDPRALSVMVYGMERDPKVGICGGKIKSYDGKRLFHTGIGIDILGYPIVRKKIFYVEGSALIIRKRLFERLGGFDPKYFMFHEDIDLAWRVRLLGYRVIAFPKAIVYHVGGAQAGGGEKNKGRYRSSLMRRYHSEAHNIRTILKNYHWLTLLVICPLYLFINIIEILFLLITGQVLAANCYLKALGWNLMNLPDTLKERSKIQQKRIVSDREIIKNMFLGSGKLFAIRKAGIPLFR